MPAAFLHLYPSLALVTSVDAEHLDYYGSLEALEQAFGQFLARLPFCGRSVLAGDGLVGERVLAGLQRPHQTYGMDGDNDYRIAELEERAWGSRFALCFDGQKLGEIELQVHGVHNVRNAAGGRRIDLCATGGVCGDLRRLGAVRRSGPALSAQGRIRWRAGRG